MRSQPIKLLKTGSVTNISSKEFTITGIPEDTKLLLTSCNLASWSAIWHWVVSIDEGKLYEYSGSVGSYALSTAGTCTVDKTTGTVTVYHNRTGGGQPVYYSCFG